MNQSEHSKPTGQSTRCIHAGNIRDAGTGSVRTPIFPSTVFSYPNPSNLNIYPRYFNVPNQRVINEKMSALEHGEAALVFGSGMAAISTLLFSFLKIGDHAVFQSGLYGGTHKLVTQEFGRQGIEFTLGESVTEISQAIRPETRIIYVESPTNPLLRCIDLPAIASLGRERKILTVIDNTFATPINQNPLDHGLDMVVHSATKYLNGHSDLNAGVIVSSHELIDRVKNSALNYGGMLDARVCSLLERGMQTLALRVRQHNENAQHLAEFLTAHPAVARVYYPGLTDHPDHATAARQMRGFGGMLSFELVYPEKVQNFLSRLQLVAPALSLGGVESLVCVPSLTSHRDLSTEERKRFGISDSLIRVSTGIEDVHDIIDDISQALDHE